jgi:hypothetical protein
VIDRPRPISSRRSATPSRETLTRRATGTRPRTSARSTYSPGSAPIAKRPSSALRPRAGGLPSSSRTTTPATAASVTSRSREKRSVSAIATERTARPRPDATSERLTRVGPGANATTSYVPSSRVVADSIGRSAGSGSAGIPGKETDSLGPDSVTRTPANPPPPRVTRPGHDDVAQPDFQRPRLAVVHERGCGADRAERGDGRRPARGRAGSAST